MNNSKKISYEKKTVCADTNIDTNTDTDSDSNIESAIPRLKYNIFKKLDNVSTNQESSFILKKTKKTGNFQILKKTLNKASTEKVKYIAYNVYLPFGREEYNDNLILNAVINDSTNYNHNLITTLKQIINTFEKLKTTDVGKYKYSINDKTFFSYMKELKQDTELDTNTNTNTAIKSTQNPVKKYQLRLYLRYGAKVTHISQVGELSYDQLKGKKCNLNLELGSMWVNNDTMMYGINIHVTHITVIQ
jgi:hypothetical protein